MADATDLDRRVREGIALFNRGRYFDAHEEWELAWHATDGTTKATLQVLIQLAVAMEHDKRGNPRGSRRTLDRARARCEALEEAVPGLPDPHALLQQVQTHLHPTCDAPHAAPRIPDDNELTGPSRDA